MDHSACSSAWRTSTTVTFSPFSSHSLSVIASTLSRLITARSLPLYRQPRRTPLGEPFSKAACPVATRVEQPHRLVGEHAVRPPAVGDDLLVLWNLLQIRFQPLQGHRACAGDVPSPVLLLWAHVEYNHVPLARLREQLLRAHRL